MAYAGLLLFFVVEYLRPTSFIPALLPLRLNLLVPLFTVIAAMLPQNVRPGISKAADRNHVIIGAILVLVAISIPTAFVGEAAQIVFETLVGYAAIYWVVTRVVTSQSRIKGVFAMVVMVHIVIMLLSPEMLIDPSSRTHGMRSGSFLGDGNDFALSLVIAIPFALFLLFESKSPAQKVLMIPSLLFLIVGVIASQSRGGTIALACVGLYYWLKSGKRISMALVAAAALAVVFAVAPPSYFNRMNTITDPTDGSAQGRINSWKLAWKEALQNPILGIGAGNTPYMHRQNAHSIYFMVLGELGFPGLFALLALIVWNLVANKRLLKEVRPGPSLASQRQLLAALSASLIAFATAGAFLSAAYYPHAYILAGLLSAGRRIVRDRNLATAVDAPALASDELAHHWALAPSSSRTPRTSSR